MPFEIFVILFGWIGYCMWLSEKYDIFGLFGGMWAGMFSALFINYISARVYQDFLELGLLTFNESFLIFIACGVLLYFFVKKQFSSKNDS